MNSWLTVQSYCRTLYVSPPVPPNERKIFSRYQLSAVTDWLPLRMRRLCLSTTVQGGGISRVRGSASFVLKFALPPFSPPLLSGVQYRAEGISWVKCSVCFVLKFALPPFSPPSPLEFKL